MGGPHGRLLTLQLRPSPRAGPSLLPVPQAGVGQGPPAGSYRCPLPCSTPALVWAGQPPGSPHSATPGGPVLLAMGLAMPLHPRRAPDQPWHPRGPASGQQCPSQTWAPRPWEDRMPQEECEGPEMGSPQPRVAPGRCRPRDLRGTGPCQGNVKAQRRGVPSLGWPRDTAGPRV